MRCCTCSVAIRKCLIKYIRYNCSKYLIKRSIGRRTIRHEEEFFFAFAQERKHSTTVLLLLYVGPQCSRRVCVVTSNHSSYPDSHPVHVDSVLMFPREMHRNVNAYKDVLSIFSRARSVMEGQFVFMAALAAGERVQSRATSPRPGRGGPAGGEKSASFGFTFP